MTKKRKKLLPLLLIAVLLLAAAAAYALLTPKTDARTALREATAALVPETPSDLNGIDGRIARAVCDNFSLTPSGNVSTRFHSAIGGVHVHYLDVDALTADLAPEMQALLSQRVEQAGRRSEVYDSDGQYLPALVEQAYANAVAERLTHVDDYCRHADIPVTLSYAHGAWSLDNEAEILSYLRLPEISMPGLRQAVPALTPVDLHYSLPDRTSPGPVPDAACFGETTDPAVIAELLATDTAQRLIGGQATDWTEEKETLPGRPIYYYLDETILALVWQEDEHGAVGTFAEVFLADASQLRRKIADDNFASPGYEYPTVMAQQANAVVAVSGDFFNSGRPTYGVSVYDGQIGKYWLADGQTCYFDDQGDMLFSYEKDFADAAEAQRFVDEHRVSFSLAFGPVMVDHGQDVTPYSYPLGEVLDTYARCAIGQLGKLHYLAMTINCESPDYYVYVTLRQAADSMIAHGCQNAYTLDGGQTGSIIIGGRLINPVQFGVERQMSDIVYFATALPAE